MPIKQLKENSVSGKNKTKKIKKKQICEKNERKCKYTFWHQNLIIMLREDWLAKKKEKETRYCF